VGVVFDGRSGSLVAGVVVTLCVGFWGSLGDIVEAVFVTQGVLFS